MSHYHFLQKGTPPYIQKLPSNYSLLSVSQFTVLNHYSYYMYLYYNEQESSLARMIPVHYKTNIKVYLIK